MVNVRCHPSPEWHDHFSERYVGEPALCSPTHNAGLQSTNMAHMNRPLLSLILTRAAHPHAFCHHEQTYALIVAAVGPGMRFIRSVQTREART